MPRQTFFSCKACPGITQHGDWLTTSLSAVGDRIISGWRAVGTWLIRWTTAALCYRLLINGPMPCCPKRPFLMQGMFGDIRTYASAGTFKIVFLGRLGKRKGRLLCRRATPRGRWRSSTQSSAPNIEDGGFFDVRGRRTKFGGFLRRCVCRRNNNFLF